MLSPIRTPHAVGTLSGLVLALLATASPVRGQVIEVIYSEVTGDPTAIVPGAEDAGGLPLFTEFKALEDFTVSPDGTFWLLKARSTAGSDLETFVILGSGTTGSILAQEGRPIVGGAAGELYDFFDPVAGFDSAGAVAFGARARGGDPATKEKVIVYDGSFTIVAQESDPALGLLDLSPDPSGDELFGNSLNSIHLLDDGRVGFVAVTLQNVHSSRRPALFYDDTAFAQSGVTPIDTDIWDSFSSNAFFTSLDGKRWLARGDDEGDVASDEILAVDGAVVLREGAEIASSGVFVADIFDARMTPEGTWLARGDDASDDDWAVRNGSLIARTGDPIILGSGERWGAVFAAVAGSDDGRWALCGSTDNADPTRDAVIVLSGEMVLVREGDPVDLDGNGTLDDDAFVGRGDANLFAFSANDLHLGGDGYLYFVAPLRDGAGADLGAFGNGGEAFLRLPLPPACGEGTTGAGTGTLEEPLLLNSGAGGPLRRVHVGIGESITLSLDAALGGPDPGRYVIWAWPGVGVAPTTLSAMGAPLGCTVNPSPLRPMATPQPVFCLLGQGIPLLVCGSTRIRQISPRAPFSATKAGGLMSPVTFTFQGLLEDDGSLHPSGFSITNSLTLVVE